MTVTNLSTQHPLDVSPHNQTKQKSFGLNINFKLVLYTQTRLKQFKTTSLKPNKFKNKILLQFKKN